MSTDENTITNAEEAKALPTGQWAVDADGKVICLMDTHMGFPQRMWGSKRDGGTKGRMVGYYSLDRAAYPIRLADVDTDACPHKTTNECGQCDICGLAEVGAFEPCYFEPEDEAVFRAAAAHNARIEATR